MDFRDLVGKTLVSIEDGRVDDESIYLTDDNGQCYCSQHMQDCCESVSIRKVDGYCSDILGSKIVKASESHPDYEAPPNPDSYTWTEQVIETENGKRVVWLWLGESNGYYGESPYFSLSHKRFA